jgi:ubiquinone/menaquinone biosynthesis C-methylase UbiE
MLRAAERGDWRMRAACLSAAGRIAGNEPAIWSVFGMLARRVPGLSSRIPVAGLQGRYVRGTIANGLVDRAWPVRVAAALALGECRSPLSIEALQGLLLAPFRSERIAAAAAILACGGTPEGAGRSLLEGSAPVPPTIGDRSKSLDVLTALASVHSRVLEQWQKVADQQPSGADPAAWGAFLAGTAARGDSRGLQAEIDRYDAEGDTEYVLAKPFSPINRAQNTRLLHTFGAICEHLRAPVGARVLDLGGGSAWVSELLARLGYTPVTLDVSSALLSVGRLRMSRQGLTPRLVAGDMTRLPLASSSMSAVIVTDALHHVPDVPAVFREAFRVLETGGAFLLAEPGEGHSETEKSRGEMLEFGVHEREIHVAEMFDYASQAGFDDVRIVPHFVPSIGLTRSQLDAATRSPADEWRALNDDQVTDVPAFVMQSMFDHPLFVCRKGRRAADSIVPAVLRADIRPRLTRQGRSVTGLVSIRNTGDTLWLRGEDRGHVQLGVQLLSPARALLSRDFTRASLPGDLAAGQSADVPVAFELPDTNSYVLKIDLVDEGVCWFEDVGSRPMYVSV